MSPIELLMSEHRRIEKVIGALESFGRRLADGKPAPREDLGSFVEFIREFADRAHHGKEEDVLFAALVEHGMSRQGGPVAVMLYEHGEGRAFVAELAAVAAGKGALAESERTRALAAARGYAELLRNHIHKEDGILYPMAERLLPPAVWEKIAARFADFESRRAAERARLEGLADRLAETYGA